MNIIIIISRLNGQMAYLDHVYALIELFMKS